MVGPFYIGMWVIFTLVLTYRQGKRVYSEVGCSGYLKIDVGVRWRLLSKNRGENWLFMSHQTYDREMKQ